MSSTQKNTETLISIIIPLYNAEKHIESALISLLNQSFNQFEVLLINDGSTDNSVDRINEIVNQDCRFKIINQKNSGPGAARNRGIDLAKGMYLSFLDSDDYFDIKFLKKMYKKAVDEMADIVVCDFDKVSIDGSIIKEYKHHYNKSLNNLEAFVDILQSNYLTSISPNKIFHKTLFNKVRYPEGIKVSEDIATIYKLVLKAKKISFVKKTLFHYVQMPGSSMNSFNVESLKERLFVSKMIRKDLEQKDLLPKFTREYNIYYLLNVVLSGCIQICKYSPDWSGTMKIYLEEVDSKIFTLRNIIFLWKRHKKKMFALLTLKVNNLFFRKLLKLNI